MPLRAGEGVAAEALLDQVPHADDPVGRHVVQRLVLALLDVDALAAAAAPRWPLSAGSLLRTLGTC